MSEVIAIVYSHSGGISDKLLFRMLQQKRVEVVVQHTINAIPDMSQLTLESTANIFCKELERVLLQRKPVLCVLEANYGGVGADEFAWKSVPMRLYGSAYFMFFSANTLLVDKVNATYGALSIRAVAKPLTGRHFDEAIEMARRIAPVTPNTYPY